MPETAGTEGADGQAILADPEGEAHRYAEAILGTTRQPLLVLDGDLRVETANRAFYRAFAVDEAETRGRLVYELGNAQWNIPELRDLLERILPGTGTVEDFRVAHAFEHIGHRTMLLNARRMPRAGRADTILLAIDDITEQERTRWLLEGEREYARKLIETSRASVLVLGWDLHVRAANRAFCTAFGVSPAETEGRPIYALGSGQWNIPRLRELLERVLPDNDAFDDFEVEHDFDGLGPRIMVLNARRIDHVQLILLAIEDRTEARRADRALRRNEALLSTILHHAPVGIGLIDRDGAWIVQNDRLRALSADVLPSCDPAQAPLWHPADGSAPADWPGARALRGDGPATLEFRREADGQTRWLRVSAVPVEIDGAICQAVVIIEDTTDDRRAEQERELLLDELNHRVKNLFMVFRALLARGQDSPDVEAYRATLKGRLDALAGAHAVALEGRWRSIDLLTIADRTLRPYATGNAAAVAIEGEPLPLPARQALSVSLALHELATNAVKYGALAAPTGRVRLTWRTAPHPDGPRVELAWHETGGPPAADPERRGFGLSLIERVFAHDLEGEAEFAFPPEGLHLDARFPLG